MPFRLVSGGKVEICTVFRRQLAREHSALQNYCKSSLSDEIAGSFEMIITCLSVGDTVSFNLTHRKFLLLKARV